MVQLMKRSGSYKHVGKRLKFLADWTRNTDIDDMNMKLIICHYKEDMDEKLFNECLKFKEYLRWSMHTNTLNPLKSCYFHCVAVEH